ncbi:MAG: putative exporter, partial [Myxococcota bacterium]
MTQPGPRGWLPVALTLLVAAGLGAFVATQMAVTTDITHFMPHGKGSLEVALARQITQSELSRTIIVLVEAPSEADAVAASLAVERSLRADPALDSAFATIVAAPAPGVDEALWELYYPRRFSFVAPTVAETVRQTGDAMLDKAATRLKDRLASPMSTLLTRVAPGDPLLILPDLFDRALQRKSGSI